MHEHYLLKNVGGKTVEDINKVNDFQMDDTAQKTVIYWWATLRHEDYVSQHIGLHLRNTFPLITSPYALSKCRTIQIPQ